MNDTASVVAAERAAPSTARDAQRSALSDLLGLMRQCAAVEASIRDENTRQVEAADKDLDRARLQADHQLSSQSQEFRSKYEHTLADIRGRHDSDAANTTEADRVRRLRVNAEVDLIQRDARKQLEHAIWLADSVSDGTQAKVKTDVRKATDERNNDLQALTDLESSVEATLERYGYTPAADAPTAALDEQTPAPELFKHEKQSAEDRLKELRALGLPKLLVGIAPWLLGILLLGLSGGAGYLFLAGRMEDWQAVAAGAGVGVLVLIALALAMNLMARRQVRHVYLPLQQSVATARLAAEKKLKETRTRLESMAQRALQQREVEVRAAKDKSTPAQQRAISKHSSAVSALDRELESKLQHLHERRDKATAEIESWYSTHMTDLKARVDRDLSAAAQKHEARHEQIRAHHQTQQADLLNRWKAGLSQIQQSIGHSGDGKASSLLDWTPDALAQWSPPKEFPSAVRFGQIEVDAQQILAQLPPDVQFTLELPKKFHLPAVLALPRQASLLIQADRTGRPAAIATLQMLMARLLTSIPPGRVKFTIMDPVALGQNFAGFMHLADYDETLVNSRIWTDPEHIEQRLADLTEHMETVIQKYLRNEFETIDDYNRQAGELAEPYRFLVISDFPHGFQPEAQRRLASIASTGARCGVYTLIFRDTRQPVPAGGGFDDVEAHSVNLVQNGDHFTWKDEVFAQFPLNLDAPPPEEMLTKLMHTVGKLAREANRVEVPFSSIAPRADQFWSMSAKTELRVPIGRMGATRQQHLRLGRGVAQHTLVAGKTGSGKSTLLHAIITNAAMWYSPDEVELYLIDFKKGVEFKTYASSNLPHARAIAVESDREFGLSVLQRIDAEMTRRGEMFRDLGVQDLAAYRDSSQARLQRILLIIDEFQEFFSEDDKLAQDSALLIDRLVRQGRAFGIHVLLGSQTIGGSSGLSRSTLGQMAVRVALQCSEADSQLILGDNNSAARLLTRPGEAIYNDAGGLVEGNSPFQIAWLPDAQRDGYLHEISGRMESLKTVHPPAAIIFEGNAPADIRKNQTLARIILGNDRPSVPLAFLGEPVAIKDPTSVGFRRQAGSNMLIVGQGEEQALAMVISSILSLSATLPPDRGRFVVLDGTPADSPLQGRLPAIQPFVKQEMKLIDYRGTADAISGLSAEIKRRQETDDASAPPIFLVIFGLQRYRLLRKTDEGFGFGGEDKPPAPDKQFAEILREGPGLGVHVIAWADTAVSVDRTIERNALREFDNRVLMQMSAADSSTLIDSPAANKLGFYRAIAYSEEQGVIEKFRPYAVPPAEWLGEFKK